MDEPLSYLDVRNQLAIVQLIRDVARRRNLTVLLIAHDVNPLLAHIDQVLYVAAGKVATGTPNEIITTERLSEIYSAPVEVIRDSHGRVFVAGREEGTSHPHALRRASPQHPPSRSALEPRPKTPESLSLHLHGPRIPGPGPNRHH